MSHWMEVFSYELRQQFRRKAYRFITFGVPAVALILFFGYQAYKDATRDDEADNPAAALTSETEEADGTHFGYVDLTPQRYFPAPQSYPEVACAPTHAETAALTDESRSTLIQRLSSPYCLRRVAVPYDSLEAGRAALEDGAIDALYVVEPDFAQTGEVSSYLSGFSLEITNTDQVAKDFLLRSLLYNADIDPATYESLYLRLRNPAFVAAHRLDTAGAPQKENEDASFLLVYGFGLGMMLSVFWGGGYLMQSVVQEKESRVIEIILSSVRPMALLAGKIFAMGLASLLQVALLMGTFIFIATRAGRIVESLGDLEVPLDSLGIMAVYFVLGFLLLGGLMASIGALVSNVRESQSYVTFVTLPSAVPFFFTTVFAEEPNSTLAVALSMFPLTSPLSMIMRLAVTDVPTIQIVASLVLLVLGVVFAIWLAGRLFRVRILLTGNAPKLRDIPALLRG